MNMNTINGLLATELGGGRFHSLSPHTKHRTGNARFTIVNYKDWRKERMMVAVKLHVLR